VMSHCPAASAGQIFFTHSTSTGNTNVAVDCGRTDSFRQLLIRNPNLWAVARYIEQNPVKSALVTRPEDYLWSSCRTNIRGQEDGLVTGKGWLDEKDRKAYRTFLMQTNTLMD